MKKILLLIGLVLSSILVLAQEAKSQDPVENGEKFAETFLQMKQKTLEQRQNLTQEEREIQVGRAREEEMKASLVLTKDPDLLVARALNIYMQPEEDFAVEVAFDNGFIKQALDEIANVRLKQEDGRTDNVEGMLNAFAPLVYLTNTIAEEKSSFEKERQLIEVYMGRMRVLTADKYRLSFRDFIRHYKGGSSSKEYNKALATFLRNVEKGEKELLPTVRLPS